MLWVAGCSAIEHGYRTGEIAGRTLSLRTSSARERIEMESAYDATVAEVRRRRGEPDYLHVLDRDHLYLFYPDDDLVVTIVRAGRPPGKASEQSPIPGHYFRLLPDRLVAEIQRERAERQASRPKRALPPPAARAPDTDSGAIQLTGFDLETLIARFRTPMSAADPGVSGWREVQAADGTRAGVAASGATYYRVDRVAVIASTHFSSARRSPSAEVSYSVARVNRVVFGTRAAAVDRALASAVAQVAADSSGRTNVRRRVEGRTVSIERDVRTQRFVYAVRAS